MALQSRMIKHCKVEWKGEIGSPARRFTKESKQAIAKMIVDNEISSKTVAKLLEIQTVQTVTRWVQNYIKQGTAVRPDRRTVAKIHLPLLAHLEEKIENAEQQIKAAEEEIKLAEAAYRLGYTLTRIEGEDND